MHQILWDVVPHCSGCNLFYCMTNTMCVFLTREGETNPRALAPALGTRQHEFLVSVSCGDYCLYFQALQSRILEQGLIPYLRTTFFLFQINYRFHKLICSGQGTASPSGKANHSHWISLIARINMAWFWLWFIIFLNWLLKGSFHHVPHIGLKSLNLVHQQTFIWEKKWINFHLL